MNPYVPSFSISINVGPPHAISRNSHSLNVRLIAVQCHVEKDRSRLGKAKRSFVSAVHGCRWHVSIP